MKLHWIIQANMFREDGFDRLITTLDRLECSYSVHKVVPFAGILNPPIPGLSRAIVLGSYTLCNIAQEQGWVPGAFIGPGLDFEEQIKHWGDTMLNAKAKIYRFSDVPEQENPFFLRPTLDSKAFSGKVYDWPEFSTWRNQVLALSKEEGYHGFQINEGTKVMVCPKREIWSETRFWIINGKIATASRYKIGTRVVSQPDSMLRGDPIGMFANSIAYRGSISPGDKCTVCGPRCRWEPHKAYCLDVADTSEGPKIIEVNCLNASGFYGADMHKLVEALEDMYP